jgi:hypothetical protein
LTVVNDPRSVATSLDLARLLKYERGLANGIGVMRTAINELSHLKQAVAAATTGRAELATSAKNFDVAANLAISALASNRGLAGQLADLEFADLSPTPSTVAAITSACTRADASLQTYRRFLQTELVAMLSVLAPQKLVTPTPVSVPASACGLGR